MKTLIKGDDQIDVSTMLLFPRTISDHHGKVCVPVFGDKNSKTNLVPRAFPFPISKGKVLGTRLFQNMARLRPPWLVCVCWGWGERRGASAGGWVSSLR